MPRDARRRAFSRILLPRAATAFRKRFASLRGSTTRALMLASLGLLAPPSAQGGRQDEAQWAELRAAMQKDEARALVLVDSLLDHSPARLELRYARARLLEARGQVQQALQAYAGLPRTLPEVLRDEVETRQMRLFVLSGQCSAAQPLLARLEKRQPKLRARWLAMRGQCALRAQHPEEALRHLEAADAAQGGVDRPALRFQIARALWQKGEKARAIEALKALYKAHPDHPDSDEWRRQLELLGAWSEPSPQERLALAKLLYESKRYSEALAQLDTLSAPAAGEALASWLHLRGMSLLRSRLRYEEAYRALREAARLPSRTQVDDAFYAAQLLSKLDRDQEAAFAYHELARRFPAHSKALEAAYMAAWLEIRHARREGEVHMRRFLEGKGKQSTWAQEARWYLGMRAYERKRYADAERWFADYARQGRDAMTQGRGWYWTGRCRHKLGHHAPAIEAYKRALGIEPLHWYSLWARQRMLELGEDRPPAFAPAQNPRAPLALRLAANASEDAALRFYLRLGLRDEARRLLRRQESASLLADDKALRGLLKRYEEIGDHAHAQQLVLQARRPLLLQAPRESTRWIWDLAYPRPWPRAIARAEASTGLEAALLYAVMRQESSFAPEVVSYAGAIGLLQLMPQTAEGVARRLGVDAAREALFDPERNIALGAAYLKELRDLLGDCPPLIFAAYNAGEDRVQAWQRERPYLELDHFVERIPYEQTRNYVRRVTTHFAKYRYLERPPAGWPLRFSTRVTPSGCLEGGKEH